MGKTLPKQITYKIDYNSNVFYFPIRHHSPICSLHLKEVIKEYKPDCILIEGPSNINMIKNHLVEEDVVYPIALYCSYKENDEFFSSYYPLLKYSPELVALEEATKLNINSEFIDLPFVSRIKHSKLQCGINKPSVETSLSDDYLVSTNQFIEAIYKKEECRNFDEYWEKVFEINCLNKSTQQFIDEFNTYTFYLRELTNKETLEDEAILIREEYMYNKILEAKQKYNKILVVSGGFHIHGFTEKDLNGVTKTNIEGEYTEMYLLPYTMQQTDITNGYASGMKAVNYYDKIYNEILKDKDNAYNNVNLDFLNLVSNRCSKNKLLVTIPDKISAFQISKGLANLRGKIQPGKYELQDCITSTFIKGEYKYTTAQPIEFLNEELIGNKVGSISSKSPTPPIYNDFIEKSEMYKLNLNMVEVKLDLSVFSSEKHRSISRLLHQLSFLNNPFAKKVRGSNIKDKKDRNLIKEVWEYKYTTDVQTNLLINSMYGATINLAAKNFLYRQLKECNHEVEAVCLLIDSFLMGIKHYDNYVFQRCYQIINSSSDFFACCKTLEHLVQLKQLSLFYDEEDLINYDKLIEVCFNKCMYSLPFVSGVPEELELNVVSSIKLLFDVLTSNNNSLYLNDYIDILTSIVFDIKINPCIEGGILGILFSLNNCNIELLVSKFSSYLNDVEYLSKGTRYLTGLFKTAREVIFISKKFITELDKLLDNLSYDDFIELVPDFRMAFSNFIPSEVNKIAKNIKSIYEENINSNITDEGKEYGLYLNDYLINKLKELE